MFEAGDHIPCSLACSCSHLDFSLFALHLHVYSKKNGCGIPYSTGCGWGKPMEEIRAYEFVSVCVAPG